jgi:hypothetical protein
VTAPCARSVSPRGPIRAIEPDRRAAAPGGHALTTLLEVLELARAALAPAADNAANILSNPDAQPDPRAVAEAWDATDPALAAAQQLLDGTPAGTESVAYLLAVALDAVADGRDAATRLLENPNAGRGPKDVANALLEAEPLIEEARDLLGSRDTVPIPPEPLPSGEAPMYVPNLTGLRAVDLRNAGDVQEWLRTSDTAGQYGLVAPGVQLDGLTDDARGGTIDHPKVLCGQGALLKQARLGKPWLWLDDFVFPAKSSGASLVLAAEHLFATDCLFHVGNMQQQTCVTHDGPAFGARIGRCRFDSNQRSGTSADVVQSFSKSQSTNPDYWDIYLCDFQTTTQPGQVDKQHKNGMNFYAEPGIDSGNQDDLSPSEPMDDYSQHHSIWRRCRIRTSTKFGWYAKHVPRLADSDLAYVDAAGNVLGYSHVVAYRGGSSLRGQILRTRSECSPYQPGASSTSRQAFALQSWFHELGWCAAIGGCIAVYCYCPHTEGGRPVYGSGSKPLQAAHYAHLWRNSGTLVLGATRKDGDGGINPTAPVEGVLIEAHDGPIYDDTGKKVQFDPESGRITSSHKWITTEQTADVPESPTGGDHCLIRAACDRPEMAPAEVGAGDVGPGAQGCVPWDGRDTWP